jgi:hypothetical protein
MVEAKSSAQKAPMMAYGAVPLGRESEHELRLEDLPVSLIPEFDLQMLFNFFNDTIRGRNYAHAPRTSMKPALILTTHQHPNCDVYSSLYPKFRSDENGVNYDKAATSILMPTDGRITFPLIETHSYKDNFLKHSEGEARVSGPHEVLIVNRLCKLALQHYRALNARSIVESS